MMKFFRGRSLYRTIQACIVVCLWSSLQPDTRAASATAWRKVSTPEFTVITPLSEKQAKAWANDFSQFISAMGIYFPKKNRKLPPLTFVVFDRERDFRPYRPVDKNGKAKDVSGFFLREESWAIAGMSGGSLSKEIRRTIFHEGTHWFLSSVGQERPMWFEEGLAEVFSTFRINKDRAEWGQSIDENVIILEEYGFVPLEELLFITQENLYTGDDVRTTRLYGQSWVFVHYLLFGEHDMKRDGLQAYLDQRGETKDTDPAFRAVFGRTYKQMDLDLRDYMSRGTFRMGFSKFPPPAEPVVEPASPIDVANALARLAYASGNLDEAARQASLAIAADPTDPRGHEINSLILLRSGRSAEGWAALEQAERYGSKDYRIYMDLARSEHQVATAPGREQMSGSDARRIAERYRKAIEFSPGFRTAYVNFAGMMGAIEVPRPEDKATLLEGERLFPHDPLIEIGLAMIERRDGDLAGARARVEKIITAYAGKTDETADYARRVHTAWAREDLTTQLNQLVRQRNYADALTAVNAFLETTTDESSRAAFTTRRSAIIAAQKAEQVEDAVDAARWDEARRLIGEVLQLNPSASITDRMQQLLRRVEQQSAAAAKNN